VRARIGGRIVLAAGLVVACAIAWVAIESLRVQRRELTAQITRSADLLSETVKSSTRDYMLGNHREQLRRQIEAIGAQTPIEKVRVFNKEGRIVFSSDPGEVGTALDKRAESCDACHAQDRPLTKPKAEERARIFEGREGHRVLGIVNPIQNQPSCTAAACHAHRADESVLGVLDVTVSLADVDRQVALGRRRMAGQALLAILASGLLLFWLSRRLIGRPVADLAEGTRRVAEGDLTTTIPATARHELGDLARAFNDMTLKLAEARSQLTQADKLASVGRLAAGVAHEINNPLTGVLSYASLLLDAAGDDPQRKADLEVIVRETKRCREIVRGLLDFARQTPPRRQPTDLNDVARRAVAVVLNQLQISHVALRLDLSDDLPQVEADANQMQQVLVNLLLNGADAIGERGGTIRLATRRAAITPLGHEPIRKAACPKGCDLLDGETRVGGLAAIRVLRRCAGRESLFHLDPVYGRRGHLAAEPVEEGMVAEMLCARCRMPLADPALRCDLCGSPTFAVRGPEGEPIHWCSRKACRFVRWADRDGRGATPMAEISVDDDGRGIPRDALPRLFEPFFSTKGVRGTGLGLAITWGIVEGHGGTIEVESEVGRGSRFIVRLPIGSPEPKREAEAA
jgi:two-component system NtrC family sensor kinase